MRVSLHPLSRTFYFDTGNHSPAAFYANTLERINLLLPSCTSLPRTLKREPWRIQGRLYRSKVASLASKSICTVNFENEGSWHCLVDAAEFVELDGAFESILSKLTLMYAPRQAFVLEGVQWVGEEGDVFLRVGALSSGSDCVGVVLETNRDSTSMLVATVFPDASSGSCKLVAAADDLSGNNHHEQRLLFVFNKLARLGL